MKSNGNSLLDASRTGVYPKVTLKDLDKDRCDLNDVLEPGTEATPPQGPLSMPEARIAAIYVLLASIWIIGSDAVLVKLVGNGVHSVYFQTCKGLNFVITTGVLLYIILRRAYGGWRRAEEQRMECVRLSGDLFRRLSSRIQNLREDERTRISREIHDELGQLLTGTKMQLRLIENRLADHNERVLNPLLDDLVEASGMIDECIESVRRISSGLRPLALDHLGLEAALNEEVLQFSRRSEIECNLATDGMDVPLPSAVETAAFRIFQESLTNVARHSKATKLDAECSVRDGKLILRIRDDGVGMSAADVSNPGSLGLVGMLERAAGVGGRIFFSAQPKRGTEVLLTIPLTDSISHETSTPPLP